MSNLKLSFKEQFDQLPDEEKVRLVSKAMAWFCAADFLYNKFGIDAEDAAVIKVILGKYMNQELVEVYEIEEIFNS